MVKVNRSALLGALGRLARVSADKDAKVICFHMNGAEYILTADNKRQRLREIVRLVPGTGGEHWTCYPDAKKLFSVVNALDSEEVALHLTSKGGRLEVSGGTGRFTLNVYSAEYADFPPDIDAIDGRYCTVAADALHGTLSRVMHAISEDDNKYGINGVHIENLEPWAQSGSRMVATDGSRLFYASIETSSGAFALAKKTILPRETAALVLGIEPDKGEDVQVTVDKGGKFIQFDWMKTGIRMISRLFDGEFPDYRQVIGEHTKRAAVLEISTADLTRALSSVEVMIEDRNRTVRLTMYPDQVRLTVTSPKSGDASISIDAKYDGPMGYAVGMNAKYLADAAKACKAETVLITFGQALDPVLVKGAGTEGVLGVVMPMRLD